MILEAKINGKFIVIAGIIPPIKIKAKPVMIVLLTPMKSATMLLIGVKIIIPSDGMVISNSMVVALILGKLFIIKGNVAAVAPALTVKTDNIKIAKRVIIFFIINYPFLFVLFHNP